MLFDQIVKTTTNRYSVTEHEDELDEHQFYHSRVLDRPSHVFLAVRLSLSVVLILGSAV